MTRKRKKKRKRSERSAGVELPSNPAEPIVRAFAALELRRLWLDNAELLLGADIFDRLAEGLAARGAHDRAAAMAESAATFRRIATLAMHGTVTTGAAWGQKWREGIPAVITPIRATVRAPRLGAAETDPTLELLEQLGRPLLEGDKR